MKRAMVMFALVCGCTTGTPGADAGPRIDAGRDAAVASCENEGETRCDRLAHERCEGGVWVEQASCPAFCDGELGCVDCIPEERRTCVANDVRACTSEGLIGAVLEECPAENPCVDGFCGGCAANTELIYLLDAGARLYSFDPRTIALTELGRFTCPLENEGASPYSMAVDRNGRAWVLFDSGELFIVDLADRTCTASGFVPDQLGFHTFGMGFVSESPGGEETLYIAGGPSVAEAVDGTRLGTIDLRTLEISEVAPLTVLDTFFPELSGDGAGGLYGYFPSDSEYPSRVSTLRRESARIGPTWDALRVEASSTTIMAWAFARWGGDFYVFVTLSDQLGGSMRDSEFYRLEPETGELELLLFDYRIWVGAGVSTCAPLVF
jgi:hypothetical protein